MTDSDDLWPQARSANVLEVERILGPRLRTTVGSEHAWAP